MGCEGSRGRVLRSTCGQLVLAFAEAEKAMREHRKLTVLPFPIPVEDQTCFWCYPMALVQPLPVVLPPLLDQPD